MQEQFVSLAVMKWFSCSVWPLLSVALLSKPWLTGGQPIPYVDTVGESYGYRYDVLAYHLDLTIDPGRRHLSGSTTVVFSAAVPLDSIYLDFHPNYRVDQIVQAGVKLPVQRQKNRLIIRFAQPVPKAGVDSVVIFYNGHPPVAQRPPWLGGFVWKKDALSRPWVGVATQGQGASLWFPCKDLWSDKPQSAWLRFTVPDTLLCIANGRRIATRPSKPGWTTWTWHVSYPINAYNITVNIGKYAHLSDWFLSQTDSLALDYYVLDYNLQQARQHFQQVKTMLTCYSTCFGPFPFVRDGYKLVETPYWGMEHQSAISYGNDYVNNRWGFDFIIAHESAHEWWGNHITAAHRSEMWLHEGFATYAESLLVECLTDRATAVAYLNDQVWKIRDSLPMVAPQSVTQRFSDNDIYYKGSWVLHTFRSVLQDDSLFFAWLRAIQRQWSMATFTTTDLIAFTNHFTGSDYTSFFRQYLYFARPPILQFRIKNEGRRSRLYLRWQADVPAFAMPVEVVDRIDYDQGVMQRSYRRLFVTDQWMRITLPRMRRDQFEVNRQMFYVKTQYVR